MLNKSWITNLSLRGSFSTSNHTTEDYKHASSATTLAYNHSREQGYFLATNYDDDPAAPILLSPTGYWNIRSYHDSKPMNWSLRQKGDWTHRFGQVMSRLMAGAEYTGSRNNGQGKYYENLRYAENGWREYRYDELPTLNNLAFYAEEKISLPTTKRSTLEVTAGLRDDLTLISGSDYGTVSSLSPRINSRYIFWQNRRKRTISDFSIHAGWGKSVKLPSFQILYPDPRYYDIEVFKSPSTADNTTISGYYTQPLKALYNKDLQWQYTNQTDIGMEMTIKGTHISLSAFHHHTVNPYIATNTYQPISYQYTTVDDLNSAMATTPINSADRIYTIDRTTGLVTVRNTDGSLSVPVNSHNRKTYYPNTTYTNGSSIDRYGLEWMIDFSPIKALNTSVRFDGNYYYYKGLDDLCFAYIPNSNIKMTGTNEPYQYVGWYRGTDATSSVANASVANGSLSYTGKPYDGTGSNQWLAIYPEYYSTWDNPDQKIPFQETFLWAKDNDQTLYNDLCNLVVKTNNAYAMNPNRISAYYSANLSVTKEIGDHVSLSFYANNFFNNMKTVHSSQTGQDTSLFSSAYIPTYYYGLSLRLKL